MAVAIRVFDSTEQAYRQATIPGAFTDGTVLIVPAERVIGIMADGYPVGVTEAKGSFHTYVEDLAEAHGGRYVDSLAVARFAQVELDDFREGECWTCRNGCSCEGGVDPNCGHLGCWGRWRDVEIVECPRASIERERLDALRR